MNSRYVYVNGLPVVNPAYQTATSSRPVKNEALTIVSTLDDQAAMAQLTNLSAPQQFQDTLDTLKSASYIADFQAKNLDGAMLIDGLMRVFAQNEIPIGLLGKLASLQGATLHFKIDDSGSMVNDSNLLLRDACWYTQQTLDSRRNRLTRWEEAEDRMHTLIDLLAFVPTGPIILSFFDRPYHKGYQLMLDRRGKLPTDFLQEAHAAIHQMFARKPDGNTPIHLNMVNMLNEANALRKATDCRTMHYLLTDGEPSEGSAEIALIKNLLLSKDRVAASNPFTFLGCSNKREDYSWMHEIEEVAPFVAALPDFRDAYIEVKKDQGNAFPYSRGFWLLCNVAAAINPDDLDALSKHLPLTKVTLENLMGRGITENEYRRYFDFHPIAGRVFGPDYSQYLTASQAKEIRSVQIFLKALTQELNEDIDHDNVDTEAEVLRCAEQAVHNSRVSNGSINHSKQYGTMFAAPATQTTYVTDHDKPCTCALI